MTQVDEIMEIADEFYAKIFNLEKITWFHRHTEHYTEYLKVAAQIYDTKYRLMYQNI